MADKISKNCIELKLTGSPEDNGKVRLSEFREFLMNANSCLKQIDLVNSQEGKHTLYFRIADLKAESASITLEPVPYKPKIDNSELVLTRFTEDLTMIQEKKQLPEKIDRDLLQFYKGLTSTLKKHVLHIQIIHPAGSVRLTRQLEDNIESLLGEDVTSVGSMEGFLELVNVHKQNHFYIYPTITSQKITCIFQTEMLEKVGGALKRYVSVYGVLRYKRDDLFPYKIDVDSMEIYPPESELPSLASLRGIAPDATGGLESVTFIRKLRDSEEKK